ncbi:hypothetical protein EDD52_110100 [Primorskyibacter sedentarius]|uniref:Uncharacterized protein n=1 Tax=Primorskyibacter sedentarius TaxID=745311 RepID=A0A4R3JA47_9RHOB|nr:hypothetical protein [Primorskyibacter sedentarius]TCS61926.1 hypothetical protein EDD52_110100 [Primorskyibacter sedentarius]
MVNLIRWSKCYLALNGAVIVALLAAQHSPYLIEASSLLESGSITFYIFMLPTILEGMHLRERRHWPLWQQSLRIVGACATITVLLSFVFGGGPLTRLGSPNLIVQIGAWLALAAGAVFAARFGLWLGVLLQRFRRKEQAE